MNRIECKADQESETRTNRSNLQQALIVAAQTGSRSAFAQLYSLYAKSLYRIAFSVTKNREDAEDALQDAFLRAYLGLAKFRREAQFYSWIARITINSSLMVLRKQRRRRELSMEGPAEDRDNATAFDFADPRPGPEEFYGQRQTYADLLQSIGRLPTHLRVVAELRLLGEHSIDETKGILGLSEAAIKSRLFRARLRLAASEGRECRQRSSQMEACIEPSMA